MGLERQATTPLCSNTQHTHQSSQEHGALRDGCTTISPKPRIKCYDQYGEDILWTGESTYCICTHHVVHHCTVTEGLAYV